MPVIGTELSPELVGEAMVVGAATEIAFQKQLTQEVDPQSAVEAAYVHIIAGALATARDLETPEALFGKERAGAGLRMCAQVHVLAGLAIQLVGMTGNQHPPRWETLMNGTLGITPPNASSDEVRPDDAVQVDPVAQSLAARIHAAVADHDHTF
ncbi:MAG: hypothetical protein ABWY71_00590 [Candidatus Saccharimonadales bacterium]